MEKEEISKNTLGRLLSLAIIVLIIGGGVFAYIIIKQPGFSFLPKKTSENMPRTPTGRNELQSTNKDFAKAETLVRQDPSMALEYYKKALENARSQNDVDSIYFRIALATYRSGKTNEAINLFKDIVASSTVSNVNKAYSIQFITQEYFGTNNQQLFNNIFTGEPYATFLREANGDKNAALRSLVEYGENFFSLPILTLRVADYKAKDLLDIKKTGSQKNEQVNILLIEIKNHLNLADKGIVDLQGSPNIDQLPGIYNRKGVLLTKLSQAGYNLGDPAEAFSKGINYADLYNDQNTRAFLHLNYAIYLVNKDSKTNTDEIKNLLKNIYGKSGENLKIFQYLKNYFFTIKPDDTINKLAVVDPSFKSFLIGLGWKF